VDYNEEIWSFLQCVVNTVASKNQHQSLGKVFQPNLAKNTASMKIVSRNLIIIVFLLFQEIVGKIDANDIDISSLSPTAVINEIFNSTLHEIVHEVNIPIESLSEPILIGIARNTTSAGRPSSEYYVR